MLVNLVKNDQLKLLTSLGKQHVSHHTKCYIKVSKDRLDCECNPHLVTWTRCLISSFVSLLVSIVLAIVSAANLQVALCLTLFQSPQGTPLLYKCKPSLTITGIHQPHSLLLILQYSLNCML